MHTNWWWYQFAAWGFKWEPPKVQFEVLPVEWTAWDLPDWDCRLLWLGTSHHCLALNHPTQVGTPALVPLHLITWLSQPYCRSFLFPWGLFFLFSRSGVSKLFLQRAKIVDILGFTGHNQSLRLAGVVRKQRSTTLNENAWLCSNKLLFFRYLSFIIIFTCHRILLFWIFSPIKKK